VAGGTTLVGREELSGCLVGCMVEEALAALFESVLLEELLLLFDDSSWL
jgi:hypothetical protein